MNVLPIASLLILAQTVLAQQSTDTDKALTLAPSNHPLPSFARSAWTDLNGSWDYATSPADAEKVESWTGKISIPSTVGSPASGIDQKPEATSKAWFQRNFKRPTIKSGQRAHLRFSGISGQAQVWVNGTLIMVHEGDLGHFHTDITELLTEDENAEQLLTVSSQSSKDGPAPGIIRSAWLEIVPRTHLSEIEILPECSSGVATVSARIWGQANFRKLELAINNGEKEVARASSQYNYKKGAYQAELTIPDFQKWSPSNPKLYNLHLRLLNEDGSVSDEVFSYFAFREVTNVVNSSGVPRLALNGKVTPLLGIEKTTSSAGKGDDQIRAEIERIKKAGFNLVRKSGTFDGSRFYHIADQLGLLVWQDLPTPPPVTPANSKAQLKERARIVSRYTGHPSIIIWPEAFLPKGSLPYTAGKKTGNLIITPNLAVPENPGRKHALGAVNLLQKADALSEARELLEKDLSAAVFNQLPEGE